MKCCGIYAIINIINGKIYIGQSVNIYARWNSHKSELNHNKHGNIHLQNAWNKYGPHAFLFSVVLECDKNSLDYYEKAMIVKLKETGKILYNRTDGGDSRKKYTQQERLKESLSRLGEQNPFYGKHHSDESKKRISTAQQGEKNHMYGKYNELNPRSKAVFCVELGLIFPSIMEASRVLGITPSNISSQLHGRLKTSGGYHWQIVL